MAKRVTKPVVEAPDNIETADAWIRELALKQREVALIESALNEVVDGLKANAVEESKPHRERIEELFDGLFVFAERNREKLTEGDKRRSAKLPSGQLGWRTNPPTVSISKVADVIDRITSLDLGDEFLRTKQEIDKEAMLRNPEKANSISGVSISQSEQFFIKPDEEGVEESSSDTKKLRKKTGLQ